MGSTRSQAPRSPCALSVWCGKRTTNPGRQPQQQGREHWTLIPAAPPSPSQRTYLHPNLAFAPPDSVPAECWGALCLSHMVERGHWYKPAGCGEKEGQWGRQAFMCLILQGASQWDLGKRSHMRPVDLAARWLERGGLGGGL